MKKNQKVSYLDFNSARSAFYYLVVVILYLAGVTSRGTHNTDDFINWISGFIHGDFFNLYHVIPHEGVMPSESLMVPYPPFSLYILGLVAKVISFFLGESRNTILVASNFTSICFTFLTALLFSRSRRYQELPAPLYYLLTPAVFLISPILGYQDSIMSFFIVAALVSAEKEYYFLTGLLAASAVFAKQLAVMPMFGLGILIIFTINAKPIFRAVAGFALGFLLILSPFILTGTLSAYFRAQGLASVHTMVSAQNPNIPWLFGQIYEISIHGIFNSRSYSALPLRITDDNLRQFLYLIFGAATVLICLIWTLYWSKREGIRNISPLYCGAIAICTYNLLSFGVHENHFFMGIPILFMLATDNLGRRIYILASTALALNLFATGGLGRSISSIVPITQISGVLYSATSGICLILYFIATWLLLSKAPIDRRMVRR